MFKKFDHIYMIWQTTLEQKIHLATKIDFLSSNVGDKKHIMHSKSDNIDIMISHNTNKIIRERF